MTSHHRFRHSCAEFSLLVQEFPCQVLQLHARIDIVATKKICSPPLDQVRVKLRAVEIVHRAPKTEFVQDNARRATSLLQDLSNYLKNKEAL